jgi:hemoglobin
MRIRLILAALAATAVMACGGGGKKEDTTGGGGGGDMAKKSLYDRLGGQDAIKAVVDEFVANVAADDRIKSFFANTDIEKLKTLLVEQICQASGGPCTYSGRDMKTSHQGMGVKEEHFNALVEDLVKALDKFNVAQAEKDELLGLLAPMKGDIVTM